MSCCPHRGGAQFVVGALTALVAVAAVAVALLYPRSTTVVSTEQHAACGVVVEQASSGLD